MIKLNEYMTQIIEHVAINHPDDNTKKDFIVFLEDLKRQIAEEKEKIKSLIHERDKDGFPTQYKSRIMKLIALFKEDNTQK